MRLSFVFGCWADQFLLPICPHNVAVAIDLANDLVQSGRDFIVRTQELSGLQKYLPLKSSKRLTFCRNTPKIFSPTIKAHFHTIKCTQKVQSKSVLALRNFLNFFSPGLPQQKPIMSPLFLQPLICNGLTPIPFGKSRSQPAQQHLQYSSVMLVFVPHRPRERNGTKFSPLL